MCFCFFFIWNFQSIGPWLYLLMPNLTKVFCFLCTNLKQCGFGDIQKLPFSFLYVNILRTCWFLRIFDMVLKKICFSDIKIMGSLEILMWFAFLDFVGKFVDIFMSKNPWFLMWVFKRVCFWISMNPKIFL